MRSTRQVIFYIFLFLATSLYGKTMVSPIEKHPLDPSIRYGILPNGLTYYIKPLNTKDSELDIRLFIKAGSAQEESSQYQLAHVMEHYGINASKHSPTGKYYDAAKKAGIKYTDVRGWTSRESTIYTFKTSKENIEAQEIGFLLFQEILFNMKFNTKDINKERFTVLNEHHTKKGGKTANSISNKLWRSITGIGAVPPRDFEQHLRTFKESELIRFYKDWYHPNLAAIVVVGAVDDVDAMEKSIKQNFSKGSKSFDVSDYDRRKKYKNYLERPPQFIKKSYSSLMDEAVDKVYFDLYFRQQEAYKSGRSETLEARLQRKLFLNLLNYRFRMLRQSYGVRYGINAGFIENPLTSLKLRISSVENHEKKSLIKVFKHLKELHKNGFTKKEYIKEKNKLMTAISSRNLNGSSYWMEEIQNHFIHGENLPKKKKDTLYNFLKDLSMEDFNRAIQPYLKGIPDDIAMLAHENSKALTYTEKEIRSWFKKANNIEVEAYKVARAPLFLIDSIKVKNLPIASFTERKGRVPGSKEFKFKNGLTLVFKSSNSRNKSNKDFQIAIKGFTRHGAICYADNDLFSAINSAKIISHAGIGGIDNFALMRYNEKNKFKGAIKPYVNYNESGITSRNILSLEELETALQLVYLYFTDPNISKEGFEDWKYYAKYTPKFNIIQYEMEDHIKSIFSDYTHIPMGLAAIKGVSLTDMERAYAIYREIFGNAGDFTFLFTGSFSEEKVLTLCQKYLGNLPCIEKPIPCKHMNRPKKIILPQPFEKTFYTKKNMDYVRAELIYSWNEPEAIQDWKKKVKFNLLTLTMNSYLFKSLRFDSEDGNTYVTRATFDTRKDRLFNECSISFGCKEEHVDHLITEAKKIVKIFKKEPIEGSVLEAAKQTLLSILESTKAKALSKAVYHTYRYDNNWVTYEDQKAFIQSVTLVDIKRTAQKIFKNEPFEFKMKSEPKF